MNHRQILSVGEQQHRQNIPTHQHDVFTNRLLTWAYFTVSPVLRPNTRRLSGNIKKWDFGPLGPKLLPPASKQKMLILKTSLYLLNETNHFRVWHSTWSRPLQQLLVAFYHKLQDAMSNCQNWMSNFNSKVIYLYVNFFIPVLMSSQFLSNSFNVCCSIRIKIIYCVC